MNLLKFHHSRNQLRAFLISQPTPPHPSLSPPYFLSLPISPTPHGRLSASTVYLIPPNSFSRRKLFKFRNPRGSRVEAQVWSGEEEQRKFDASTDHEEAVYQKTLRLVECSMFAAVSGLAYFLSNSLAIEGYFGWFFALPIVISSMRWGLAAGRKTMVATAILLLVLSGPVKALTYLLMHGLLGVTMGTLWRLGANWGLSVLLCAFVRALGAMGYVLVSSFLIRENILALITINIHASLTYIMTAVGINTIPSMDVIYAIFGTLLMLNCGFFALLLHILYGVFFARLGMKASLTLPRWLEKAI
ncbi:uncharacterized protein LOC130768432 isoform X1 [Actinidia eriantha]|uniref:uncharacterized protein LOC130768432 isoform X1 n=1 Tax=Actinidia eriantha TaxID=165200 RepID=UPI0025879501|nr:uncharacterized protein LOC130768432 isoform X1 [Actinidia eriantha]XP_057481471.1 uncharacterized protein LOC130768432 isoform X1 [Actinidia eriantha]XP_057481472.1 uncharacterized protein LOC130768432 isoform X1 [Actinidia eriantha]XP_057481474.1 uncharacterized protein LOC130768432 isoform X1 [Actinidia eriantha]